MRSFLLFLVVFPCLGSAALCDPKKLMGPPEHFDRYQPPAAFDSATNSRSIGLKQIDLQPNGEYESQLHVDTDAYFTVALLSSSQDAINQFKVTLQNPSGNLATPTIKTNEPLRLDGLQMPTVTYAFGEPQAGTWTVRVQRVSAEDPAHDDVLTAYILVGIPGSVYMETGLTSFNLLVGDTVNMKTLPVDEEALEAREKGKLAEPSGRANFESASMDIYGPDGNKMHVTLQKEMYWDASENRSAPSGVYEGSFKADVAGKYRAVVQAEGQVKDDGNNYDFERTSWLLFNVVEKTIELTGHVDVDDDINGESGCLDSMHLDINVGVKTTTSAGKYRAYAEVWGKSLFTGEDVPIGWTGGISAPEATQSIELRIDLSYLVKAMARPPLTLRNIRLEESKHFITVSSAEITDVSLTSNQSEFLVNLLKERESLKANCGENKKGNRSVGVDGGKVVLVHGYCSAFSSYPLEYYTDYAVFEDFSQSRTNDEFAELICEFGKQFPSYSLIGHSQGGIASVHLYTYYESGVDFATGGRLLQSLGSPYGGCPLASLIAWLGELLGIGCGTNDDLTYDSMSRWSALVPEQSQRELYYYSTQYQTGGLVNYCSLPANLVLSWPNDGLAEYSKRTLEYGNSVDHKKGECHTLSMNWPPQIKDPVRSAEMNALAAR